MDVKEQDILGDRITEHWYYASKARALRRFVAGVTPGTVLDVGAGSGVFAKVMLEAGWRHAVCIDPAYEADREAMHHGKPLRFVRSIEQTDAGLVLMMDVCEHVADDAGLIREYVERCRPGTHFLITVPAFQFLFSAHDVFLEHHRRYTIGELEQRVREAGLEVLRGRYYFAAVFPIAAAQRLVERLLLGAGALQPKSNLRRHSAVVNGVLEFACRCELPVLAVNRLFGLSVFCLARIPGG